MKILICNPNTNLPLSNQAGDFKNTVAICPPLGIGYVSAALRAKGFETVMYDFFDSSEECIEAALREQRPEIVGVSCFTQHRGAALRVARLAKTVLPSVHVVFGGSHASFYPEQILSRYPECDSIVMGEAEEAMAAWAALLDSGADFSAPPAGIALRRDGKILVGDRAPYAQDLDSISRPVREVANRPPYRPYPPRYRLGRQATMMASRGCPYRCQFCSTTEFWGRKYRTRSVGNIVSELEYLVREKKIEYAHFFDDAMTARKDWILKLCEEIRHRGLRFDWEAITRVNYVDEDICRAMRAAGCKTVIFGVESFSDKILQTIGKGVTRDQAINALKTAGQAGLKTTCLLMAGNPGETWETIRETAAGLRAARPDSVDVCLTAVFPRTELYRMASDAGLLDDSYWLDETKAAPIFTVERTIEELNKFKEALLDTHWSNRWYVRMYRKSGLRALLKRCLL